MKRLVLLIIAIVIATAIAGLLDLYPFPFRKPGAPEISTANPEISTTKSAGGSMGGSILISGLMTGTDESWNERWMDSADQYYSSAFQNSFSYTDPLKKRPVVKVEYRSAGRSFQGKLSAKGLKPNFTYQMKLLGDYEKDRKASETIGHLGRWRLPGLGTNYTDGDYESYPDKKKVEAYIFFDYFVTDKEGNAEKPFWMQSSLHILFNADTQGAPQPWDSRVYLHFLFRDKPSVYDVADKAPAILRLWGQAERVRGRPTIGKLRLPSGNYQARLVLTEESFHSSRHLGGYWATVMKMTVGFRIE